MSEGIEELKKRPQYSLNMGTLFKNEVDSFFFNI